MASDELSQEISYDKLKFLEFLVTESALLYNRPH